MNNIIHVGTIVRFRYGFGAMKWKFTSVPMHLSVINYIWFGTAMSFSKDTSRKYMPNQIVGYANAPDN